MFFELIFYSNKRNEKLELRAWYSCDDNEKTPAILKSDKKSDRFYPHYKREYKSAVKSAKPYPEADINSDQNPVVVAVF